MLERISKVIHEELWMPWAKSLLNQENFSKERWKSFFVSYEDLPEEEKEKDREFARKIINEIEKGTENELNLIKVFPSNL